MLQQLAFGLSLFGVVASLPSLNNTLIPACGSEPSDAVLAATREFAASYKDAQLFAGQIVTVNVSFNVIYKDQTTNGGYISDAKVNEQIGVLNDAYKGTNLQFRLMAPPKRVLNPKWFAQAGPAHPDVENEMKTALRVGGPETLNVYTVSLDGVLPRGYILLGIATFPFDYKNEPKKDGVLLNYLALPGGPIANKDQGKTLPHEAGHWVGLYHTFQGGCIGEGDQVADTPAQGSYTNGDCPHGKDTCPLQPGLDPIQNYMDYSSETCQNQFTPGQISRLQGLVRQYRNLNV